MDTVQHLRLARVKMQQVPREWHQPIPPKERLLNDYLNLINSISELMMLSQAVVNNLNQTAMTARNLMVEQYALAYGQFLIISLRQQWTHLMVLDEEDLAKLSRFPQQRLAHQFMGIHTMLLNSYHQKRQSDFAHAWRSFLKLGLFELKLSEADLQNALENILALDSSEF